MSNNENYSNKRNKITRGVITSVGGAIPFAGGIFSAISSAWSEQEQEKQNSFFQYWLGMLNDEIKEKEKTIIEIMARLDLLDDKISTRVSSNEYQSIVKKAFREWSGVENENKRIFIRNILTNSAIITPNSSSDDVVRLFLDWINKYSEFHFSVISTLFNSEGKTRWQIWNDLGRNEKVRENSADADLYKMLIRDLSTGGIIRQRREVNYQGDFLKQRTSKKGFKSDKRKSAFDNIEYYELTEIGKQFIHYAKNEIVPRIGFDFEEDTKCNVS